MERIYLHFKSELSFLFYTVKYRPKFVWSTLLTLFSLASFYLAPSIGVISALDWLGVLGTVIGGFLTMSDIFDCRKEVQSLNIAEQFNDDELRKVKDGRLVVKGNRYYLIDNELSRKIRNGALKKTVTLMGKYQLHDNLASKLGVDPFIVLSYFRSGAFHTSASSRSKILVWNDAKVRLQTLPEEFDKVGHYEVGKTNYFDYIIAGFFSLRKLYVNGELKANGLELLQKAVVGDSLLLWDNNETLTAHHIGVNVLLRDKDGFVLYQRKVLSPGKVGNFSPSGSGSLDFKDMDYHSFERSLLNGARRELLEETGWDSAISDVGYKSSQMKWKALGMSVDLTRGMVTDFYFVADTGASIHTYKEQITRLKKFDSFELDVNSFGILRINYDSTNQSVDFVCDGEDYQFKSGLNSSPMLDIALDFLRLDIIETADQVK